LTDFVSGRQEALSKEYTRKAIILGASSGIGKELAKVLAEQGYVLGLVARRVDLLKELARALPGQSFVRKIDLSCPPEAVPAIEKLADDMNGVDLVVISAGTGFINPALDWTMEKETIDLNVSGFTAAADAAFKYFTRRGSGHLVAISSIAALRGSGTAPAYNASKAYVSSYMQGLQQKAAKMGSRICVTDIKPGLVDTAMAKGEGLFWVQPPDKAARQIFRIIKRRKANGYVTGRWRIIAWLIRIMPSGIYNRLP